MTTKTSGERKRVVILGATGSIGESALKVARDIPDRMEIVGLAANSNAEKLAAAANETRAQSVCLVDETKLDILARELEYKPRILGGEEGLLEIARLTNSEMVLVAIVGTGGLRPALAAIDAGKDLAVASKEILVMAGEIVMREARENGVNVLPVDSEHNAIFSVLGRQKLFGCSSHHSYRLWRAIPGNAPKRFRFDHTRTGAKASDMEYGAEDYDRFRNAVQ
jgi:1-deoxy-D-xylulose-5-phosphate reductoisomerase